MNVAIRSPGSTNRASVTAQAAKAIATLTATSRGGRK